MFVQHSQATAHLFYSMYYYSTFDVQCVETLFENSMFRLTCINWNIEFDFKFSMYCTSNFRCIAFSVISAYDLFFLLPKSHIIFLGVLLVFLTIVMSTCIQNKHLLYEPPASSGLNVHQSSVMLGAASRRVVGTGFFDFLRNCNEALG